MPKQKNKQYSFKWNEKIYNNHHPFNLNDKNELCIDLRNNNFMLQFYHGLFVIVPIDVVNDYRPFPPPRVEYNKRTQSSSFKPFNCKLIIIYGYHMLLIDDIYIMKILNTNI